MGPDSHPAPFSAERLFSVPNRILRDGIISSERVNALSIEAELFYRRLMSVVDDYGRFEAHPEILRARCYPLQLHRVTAGNVSTWLAECCQMPANDGGCALVTAYSVRGKKYLQINDFGQRERAERFPSPSLADKSEQVTAYARATNTHTTTPPNTNTSPEEKKKEVESLEILTTEPMDEFHPVSILAEAKLVYRQAGLPIPDKQDTLILQYLAVIIPRQKRARVMNFVKWNFVTGRWPNPAKTKAFLSLLQSPNAEWDVELAARTLPNAREPSKAEAAREEGNRIFRERHPELG